MLVRSDEVGEAEGETDLGGGVDGGVEVEDGAAADSTGDTTLAVYARSHGGYDDGMMGVGVMMTGVVLV